MKRAKDAFLNSYLAGARGMVAGGLGNRETEQVYASSIGLGAAILKKLSCPGCDPTKGPPPEDTGDGGRSPDDGQEDGPVDDPGGGGSYLGGNCPPGVDC